MTGNLPGDRSSPFLGAGPAKPELVEGSLDALIHAIDTEVRSASHTLAGLRPSRSGRGRDLTRYISFQLGNTLYAVAMANVLEIQRPPVITAVPNVPDWLLGITNLRGDIVSVVDLRRFLGMPPAPGYDTAQRIMVARSLNEELTTALLLDQVVGIRGLRVDQIQPPTTQIDERVAPYVSGIFEWETELVVLLDVERLLLSEDMRQFEPH